MAAASFWAVSGCAGTNAMAELDDGIHQPLRLRIMAALNALPPGAGLEFARLKKLTGANGGNIGLHVETPARTVYAPANKASIATKAQPTAMAISSSGNEIAR